MFERFTERARSVLVLAQEEARLLGHDYIGTEHILLGLVHEGEGVAAKALGALGVELEAIRTRVEATVGVPSAPTTGSPPFTPRAKKALELALREALSLGHNYIGTEHMLLGLVREGEGMAARVLTEGGVELAAVRQGVIQLLSGYAGGAVPAPAKAREPYAEPGCQHCGAAMAANARSRRLAVPDDDDGPAVDTTVVYCRACGRGIGAHVEPASRPTLPDS